ncbi:MAG: phage terminase large subunit family protein [Azoarcus sp.]|nr:phage terminase large subunit family protein [Azoarcus sp.]
MTVSQWADDRLHLSPEDSAEQGKYTSARAPYQRGIMDAFNEDRAEEIVVMSSAQVGKTLIFKSVVGYHIDVDPSPILVVQPTVEMAETFSKDRLAPMIRDTPVLRGKVTICTSPGSIRFPIFRRSRGTRHSASSKLISVHLAFRSSTVRTKVRIINSIASTVTR